MNKERLDYIDVVKGLSIISIVLLHFEEGLIPMSVDTFIGEFMITAFYVAVGWINATRDKVVTSRELFSKRWIQLGKPYIYWSVIIILFDIVLLAFGKFDSYILAREVYKTAVLRGIGTLWFLPALFGGELLWNWTKKFNNKLVFVLTLFIIVAYQSAFIYYFDGKTDTLSRLINAPFQVISSVGDAWIGIAFGYFMYKLFCNFLRNTSSFIVLGAGLVITAIAFCSANYYPYAYGEKYICPLLAPLGLFFIFKAVNIPLLTQYLIYWGKNSLGLMVVHFSLLMVICTMIQNKIDGTTDVPLHDWPSVFHFILTLVVSYFIVEFVNKVYPPLLGKNAKQPLTIVDVFDNCRFWSEKRNALLDKLKFYSVVNTLTASVANVVLPLYFKLTSNNPKYRLTGGKSEGPKVVVSLTSFPKRLPRLHLVIECLLRQSVKPDKIVLYLSEKQVPDMNAVPLSLRNLQNRGLEIYIKPDDLRSHKKYYYAFQEFPEDIVITVDDDMFYRSDLLYSMLNAYKANEGKIIANWTKTIIPGKEKYTEWTDTATLKGKYLLLIGVGGVLYPPHCMYKDIFDVDKIKEMVFTADDIWLTCMAMMNGTLLHNPDYVTHFLPVKIKDNTSLLANNYTLNQQCIDKLNEYYQSELGYRPFIDIPLERV